MQVVDTPEHDALAFALHADFEVRREVVDLVEGALDGGLNHEAVDISPVDLELEVVSIDGGVGFKDESPV